MQYIVWILALIVFNLKLMGYITWSWWVVLSSPIWFAALVLFVLAMTLTDKQIERLMDEDEDNNE